MRRGLIISSALHLLILFWAVTVFPSAGDRLPVTPTPLPVDLVSQAQFTKIKAGFRKAKAEQARAEKKPEPASRKAKKKPKPAKVKSVKAPAPKPKPKRVEAAPKTPKKTVKAKPKPKPKKVVKKAKPKPKKIAAKPKPALKKKKDFDPDKIAALLNKVPDAGARTSASAEVKQKPKPAKGRTDGRDLTMTFNEIDALRARISQCWNPPVGGLGADAIKVKLRLQLRKDGVLSREPEVVNRAGSPYFRAAADAAVRAVMLCQPYELPAKKYALWRDMILNFDPKEMFGG
jgi:hypothetical protein